MLDPATRLDIDFEQVVQSHRAHVLTSWSTQSAVHPLPIAGGEGAWFWTADGRRYLDFQSQLVNLNLGHQHPRLVDAIKKQADQLCYIGPSMASPPRSELAELIADVTPGDLTASFFTTGGAAAVESAVKLARHFTGRSKVITRYRSYHGGTAGTLSLSGDPRRWDAEPGVPGVVRMFDPYTYRCPAGHPDPCPVCSGAPHLEEILSYENPDTVAAVVLETITGTNGILTAPDGYLQSIREVCTRHGILLVLDEVMVGFGRTGRWFACDHDDVVPDILCVAKGINSGYVPLGAMIINAPLRAWLENERFSMGLTYSGHPLACAVAVESIKVLRDEHIVERTAEAGELVSARLAEITGRRKCIGDVRGKGLFHGVELVRDRATREPLVPFNAKGAAAAPMQTILRNALDRGLYLSSYSNIIRLSPPLITSDEDLLLGLDILDEVLELADRELDSMASLVVRGGKVVSPSGVFGADIVIDGGRVVSLSSSGAPRGDREIDARGCYVFPGGVDTHTHLENPALSFTTRSSDDFFTGTVASAFGGTTTIIDFVKSRPGEAIYDAFQDRRRVAEAKVVVDVGLHPMVPADALATGAIDQLRALAAEGATSWKFFMAYHGMMVDDATLIAGFRAAAEEGVLPMVHAENGHLVQDAIDRLVEAGMVAEHHHHAAHSHVSEQEAVHRAIAIAESVGSALFVVHVSSRLAAAEIARARDRGLPVHGETCPQYLLAAYEDYEHLGHEAAKYLCSPPIRERANQEALWEALVNDSLSTIGTDHAPFCMGQPADLPPQKGRGEGFFPDVPNGVPGIEDRLGVLWQSGVRAGRFDVCRFVDLVSTRPARLFGMYPRKGAVVPGADADLVVWDPTLVRTVSAEDHHMRTDYNLYEGMEITGGPTHVVSRGDIIIEHGELHAEAGRGLYLERGRPLVPRATRR